MNISGDVTSLALDRKCSQRLRDVQLEPSPEISYIRLIEMKHLIRKWDLDDPAEIETERNTIQEEDRYFFQDVRINCVS